MDPAAIPESIPAAPDNTLTASLGGIKAGGFEVEAGVNLLGSFATFFEKSFATAGNAEVSSVIPKIPRTVAVPKKKTISTKKYFRRNKLRN